MSTNPAPTTAAPTLFQVISWVETKHNSRAVRFEPATYEKLSAVRTDSQKAIIANIMKRNGCSWGTALMIYSSSWGETQLMGFNIYGPAVNYPGDIINFCMSETAQKSGFDALVKEMKLTDISVATLAVSSVARARFAVTYNGSVNYAVEIVAALKSYNLHVTE